MKNIEGKFIMLIDDDPGMLRALSKVLRGEGALVKCADWAGDGFEILGKREQQYDLVITDLRMPFMNGLSVIQAIHEVFPALPVMVLTAFGDAKVREACLREGAVAFLEKPLNSHELVAAVREALGVGIPATTSTPVPTENLVREKHPPATRPRTAPSSKKFKLNKD
ncbi:MAG: response regulator [Opitutaceae bacterium]